MEKDTKKELLSWRASEYTHHERDATWYWVTGGIAAILLMIAIKQQNFFFGVFILLATTVLFIFYKREPEVVEFSLVESGIHIGKTKFIPYKEIEGFTLRDRPGMLTELIIKKRTRTNPYLRIPTDDNTAIEIKDLLLQKLPEIEYKESVTDTISDLLGF